MAEHRGRRGHQHRPQAGQGRLAHSHDAPKASSLKLIGEFDNQNPVLGNQSDERNQADLRVDVDRRQIKKTKHQRTGYRERDGAEQDDQGITKTLKLGCQYEIDQHQCKSERDRERTALLSNLPRLACIIEDDRWSLCRLRGGFKHLETLRLGDARLHATEDPHGVALLEAVQCARRGTRFDMRERRHRYELTGRRFDLEVEERLHRRAVLVTDLRNDLVTTVEIVETVDVRPAQECAELSAHAGQIESQIGETLTVKNDTGFRQIDFQVRVDVEEFSALPSGPEDRADRLQHLLGRNIALQHQLHIVLAGGRKRWIQTRKNPQPGHLRYGAEDLAVHLFGRAR